MKRIISFIFAAIFCLSSLVGCTTDGPVDESTTEGTTPPGVIEEIEPIVLADSTNSYYDVVRPDNNEATPKELMQNIINIVNQKSGGLRLKASVDWVIPGTDTSGTRELLIGFTCREESKTVMDSIGYDDFAIRAVGNKIVIAAHRQQRLIEAVNYFLNNLIEYKTQDDHSVSVLYTGNYQMKSEKEFVINDDNPITGYSVVCDKNDPYSYKAAKELIASIKKFADIELPLKSVLDDETEFEIIVGKNSREATKKVLGDGSISNLDCVIGSVGRQIVIGSPSVFLTDICVENFCLYYLNKRYTYTINVELNGRDVNPAYRFEENAELAEGTDVRVMSYNILSEEWAEEAKILDGRDTSSVATIMHFAPDVVGIQEVSANWYKRLDNLFGETYKIVDRVNSKGKTNYSPLAYNTKKVKVIEHGVKEYSAGNDLRLRLMSWGLFETLDTGKRFVVINTHWDLSKNDDKLFRATHSREMADFAVELEKKYDCPIITTGDYNANESESMYKNFVKTTGYHEAKYTAKVVNRACKTTHKLGVAVSTGNANSIDHIFGSDKVEFLYFDVLVNQIVTDASDHNPIYADIKLK